MTTRRQQVLAAMGLGPSWVSRRPGVAPAEDIDRAATIATMDREALTVAVDRCWACGLGATRLRAVFGAGPEEADWLLVGAAPDGDDERAGTPFAGPPGRLLDALLASIAVTRAADAFVTHLVKCRPPGDRAPTAEEIASCRPFLERQAALVAPRIAIALGTRVGDGIGLDATAGGLIGASGGVCVIPDPASLIAAPEGKADAWAALCEVRRLSDERRGSGSADRAPSAARSGDGGASRAASTR